MSFMTKIRQKPNRNTRKNTLNKAKLLAAILCLIFAPSANAISTVEEHLDDMAALGIMYYDPDGCEDGASSTPASAVGSAKSSNRTSTASTLATGSTHEDFMWNFYINHGFNDLQTAGILGNAMTESALNPTALNELGYYGLYQWSPNYTDNDGIFHKGRSAELKKRIVAKNSAYSKYTTNEKTISFKNIPDADLKAVTTVQMEYSLNEPGNTKAAQKIKEAKSAEEAAEIWQVFYERGIGTEKYPGEELEYYAPKLGARYQGMKTRISNTQQIYDRHVGKGNVIANNSGLKAIDGSNVTWIGDTISVRLQEKGKLNQLSKADYHIQKSKNIDGSNGSNASGLSILTNLRNQDKIRDIVVFQLGGTTPGSATESSLNKVLAQTKDKAKLVVFVTNTAKGTDYSSNNKAFKQAATNNSNVVIADWEAAVGNNHDKYTGDDGYLPNDEGATLLMKTILEAINGETGENGSANGDIPDQCCDQTSANSIEDFFTGKKYDVTEGQLKGILSVIDKIIAGNSASVALLASQMVNNFEAYGVDDYGDSAEGLIEYIKQSGKYPQDAVSAYSESYDGGALKLEAVRQVIKEGHRAIPPEVTERLSFNSGEYSIFNGGSAAGAEDRANYNKNSTTITIGDKEITFYSFGDGGSGDIYGYVSDNAPKAQSNANAASEACCIQDYEEPDYTLEKNGFQYAFPIAGATKANLLGAGGVHKTDLPKIPCNSDVKGACHELYYAVDLGVRQSMINNKSSDYEVTGHYKDWHYYSSGATVTAFTSGTISTAALTDTRVATDWQDKCATITLQGDDGKWYWYAGLDASKVSVKKGDKVKAGDPLALIGAPQCGAEVAHQQAHLHFQNWYAGTGTEQGDEAEVVTIIDELYKKLPKNNNGMKVTACKGGGGIIPKGGMTLAQAKDWMKEYIRVTKAVKAKYPAQDANITINLFGGNFEGWAGCSDSILANCVALPRYFMAQSTNIPMEKINETSVNGAKVVEAAGAIGVPTGNTPKPYSIFSYHDKNIKNDVGHTGMVLGVQDDGKLIIAQASCSYPMNDPSAWGVRGDYVPRSNKVYSYAYLENFLTGTQKRSGW